MYKSTHRNMRKVAAQTGKPKMKWPAGQAPAKKPKRTTAPVEQQTRGNIDPNSNQHQTAARVHKREQQAWTDKAREDVACPRCEAKAGDYCQDRNRRPLTRIHAARREHYLLDPADRHTTRPATPSRSFSGGGKGEECPKR